MVKAKFDSRSGDTKGKPSLETIDNKVNYLLAVLLGLVIVLFVGFMTLLVMVAQMMLTYKG